MQLLNSEGNYQAGFFLFLKNLAIFHILWKVRVSNSELL